MRHAHHILGLATSPGINLHNLTPRIRECVAASGIQTGFVVVNSRHTTTALTINEDEARLLEDVRRLFERLVPPEGDYLHNDIDLRDCPEDEPRNAHAHLAAMLLGSSEVVPILDGAPDLGRWQSVLLVELDGPRERSVNIRVFGE